MEPAWYKTLDSTYYDEFHRKLRDNIRHYVDTWTGRRRETYLRKKLYAQSGIPFNDVPDAYRPSHIPKLAVYPMIGLTYFIFWYQWMSWPA